MINSTPLRILVVAEQADTGTTASWLLRRAFDPVEVVSAATAEEAATSCADRVDCILVDTQLADFDGMLGSIQSASGVDSVPLIVLRGNGDEVQRNAAQKRGVIDWLRKDQLSPAVISLTVRRAIDVASLRLMLAEQGRELERLRKNEAATAAQQAKAQPAAKEEAETKEYHAPEPTRDAVPMTGNVESMPTDESEASDVTPIAPPRSEVSHAGEQLVAPKLVTSGFEGQSAADEELAHRIQKDLMPPGAPYLEGFDVAGLSIPAAATGGDYYDFLPVGDDLLSITIGECSGQGLGPAMMMASLRAYLRVLAQSSIDLSTIVSQANTYITEDVGDEEFLVTLMLMQIDQLTKTMRYCSAGHQGHLLKRDGEFEVLHSTGMPMGLQPETVIPEAEDIRLRTGDAVLLTTDGLQKMVSPSGEKFGTDRMLDIVQKNRELPARMIVEYLRKACSEFAGTTAQNDDITIVLVKCDGADRF